MGRCSCQGLAFQSTLFTMLQRLKRCTFGLLDPQQLLPYPFPSATAAASSLLVTSLPQRLPSSSIKYFSVSRSIDWSGVDLILYLSSRWRLGEESIFRCKASGITEWAWWYRGLAEGIGGSSGGNGGVERCHRRALVMMKAFRGQLLPCYSRIEVMIINHYTVNCSSWV